MSYYTASPFDVQRQVFHAFVGVTATTRQAVKKAIKEAIEAAIKTSLKQTDTIVKKLLVSDEGIEAVLKSLGKQGWKLGDEISSEALEAAIRQTDDVFSGGLKQMNEGIERAMVETFEEGTIGGAKSRMALKNGIPSQAVKQADDIGLKLGLDTAQTAILRKSLEKSGFNTFRKSLRGANNRWIMGAVKGTFLNKYTLTAGIIGGVAILVYTGVSGGVEKLAALGEDVGLLPAGSAASVALFFSGIKTVVVAIGIGFLGLITFQVVSMFSGAKKVASTVTGDSDKTEEEAEGIYSNDLEINTGD